MLVRYRWKSVGIRGTKVLCGLITSMFARKISASYENQGHLLPCPLKWLDSFSMRSFTNFSAFDDTLPIADGLMEIGSGVSLNELRDSMEDWFRRKGYLNQESRLLLAEK